MGFVFLSEIKFDTGGKMTKPVIWFIMVVGLILIILGLFNKYFLIAGLGVIAVGLYFGLGPDGILRKEQVRETWGELIEKANGNGPEVIKDCEAFITDSKAPDIKMEHREIAPGFVTGMLGKKRDFLIISEKSFRLAPYKIYMNARDYGDNLDVSWYMTYTPSLWQAIASLVPYMNIIPYTVSDLDLFDQQDLMAYATVTHRSVLRAVDKLLEGLGQDSSKLERKSRGFLGIS
jgi:hypothetical protein